MKIAILVEGRTERAFFPFLRDFLSKRLAGQMPRLDPLTFDGRVPKEEKLQRQVKNLLAGKNPADAVIALTDIYTGTKDFNDANDAKTKMLRWVGNVTNFYPHVALHDFEAWLLPYWPRIQDLAKHNRGIPAGTPETINHNHPPSRHIEELFEIGKCRDSYSKERDAKRILQNQDLMVSINACAELKMFVNRIINISGGVTIP